MAARLTCAAETNVGLKRTNNEDNYGMVPSQGLYVLADGMGGHASGQVASTMCVSHVAQFICDTARKPGFEFVVGVNIRRNQVYAGYDFVNMTPRIGWQYQIFRN